MLEYDHRRMLSEGRVQVAATFGDAARMVGMRGRPFILGHTRNGIELAALSCVVARNGCWSLSSVHSRRLDCGESHVLDKLYLTQIGFQSYGEFSALLGECAVALESALEDAAAISKFWKEPCSVGLTAYGTIEVRAGDGLGDGHVASV